MWLREQFHRHRKDSRFIFGGLLGLLVLFAAIYYIAQRGRDLPPSLATNSLLLFVLFYINLVLIGALLFVLLRNIFKILLERHHRILGSKFKIKLVSTYIGLALLPALLLFLYGSRLLNGWIDRWFDEAGVRQVLEEGSAVAEALHHQIEQREARDARRILSEIADIDVGNPRRRERLSRRLQGLLDELELDLVAVYEDTDFVQAILNPRAGLRDLPELGRRFIREALRKGVAVQIKTPAGSQGRLIVTAVVSGSNGEAGRTLVAAGLLLDPTLSMQTKRLIEGYQGFQQIELQSERIETTYTLTFLMVTLLVLLVFSWVGLYLARRVTLPIQALAEGTERISAGDLAYRVEVDADDELGVLVRSFNSMTAELERNKETLEATNRRLTDERALVAAILENLGAGVVSVDRDGRILTFNAAALQMLGQTEAEVIGKSIHEAWTDPERVQLAALLDRAAAHRSRTVRQLRLYLNGEWKTFEAKITALRGEDGERTGQVMVLEDLTRLIRAQQMAAWSEAARRVAHEIKNPLTPIQLSAERLRRKFRQGDPELGQALEEAVDIIVREVGGMRTMVDEFSRFARMPPPQPQEVNLRALVQDTIHLYEGLKPGVELVSSIAQDAESAWLDPGQFKRVLINLLDNALEAMDGPGQVRISARRENGHLELLVSDTGQGIPPPEKDKLFLPHFSTKGRGTGLGLAIVHRIVTDHHGSIRIEDNTPHGTVFRIELPQR